MGWLEKILGLPDDRRKIIVIATARSLMSSDGDRQAFLDYVQRNPGLSAVWHKVEPLIDPQNEPLTRHAIATFLAIYATTQMDAGEALGASESLLYSKFFFPDPVTFAAIAEYHFMDEDRVAARWAEKVLRFRPEQKYQEIFAKLESNEGYVAALKELNKRMRAIVKSCAEHPEWPDSYDIWGRL